MYSSYFRQPTKISNFRDLLALLCERALSNFVMSFPKLPLSSGYSFSLKIGSHGKILFSEVTVSWTGTQDLRTYHGDESL